jgi:hypothetical protein
VQYCTDIERESLYDSLQSIGPAGSNRELGSCGLLSFLRKPPEPSTLSVTRDDHAKVCAIGFRSFLVHQRGLSRIEQTTHAP